MRKTVNWLEAKEFYVVNPIVTLADVAARFGCSVQAVKNRSVKEGWSEARELYMHQVSTKTREVAAIDLGEVQARHVKTGRALIGIGLEILSALEAEDYAKMTAKDALAFITAATDLERKALGIEILSIDLRSIDVEKLSDEELEDLIDRINRSMGQTGQSPLFGKN